MFSIDTHTHMASSQGPSFSPDFVTATLEYVQRKTYLNFELDGNGIITRYGEPVTLVLIPRCFAEDEGHLQTMRELSYAVEPFNGDVVTHDPIDGFPNYTVIVLYYPGLTTSLVEGILTITVKRQSATLFFRHDSLHGNVKVFVLSDSLCKA